MRDQKTQPGWDAVQEYESGQRGRRCFFFGYFMSSVRDCGLVELASSPANLEDVMSCPNGTGTGCRRMQVPWIDE